MVDMIDGTTLAWGVAALVCLVVAGSLHLASRRGLKEQQSNIWRIEQSLTTCLTSKGWAILGDVNSRGDRARMQVRYVSNAERSWGVDIQAGRQAQIDLVVDPTGEPNLRAALAGFNLDQNNHWIISGVSVALVRRTA